MRVKLKFIKVALLVYTIVLVTGAVLLQTALLKNSSVEAALTGNVCDWVTGCCSANTSNGYYIMAYHCNGPLVNGMCNENGQNVGGSFCIPQNFCGSYQLDIMKNGQEACDSKPGVGTCAITKTGNPSQCSGGGSDIGCGKCNTCGHDQAQCEKLTDGSCVWSPTKCSPPSQPKNLTISGSVMCADPGKTPIPIANAKVRVTTGGGAGVANYVTTDANGRYTFNSNSDNNYHTVKLLELPSGNLANGQPYSALSQSNSAINCSNGSVTGCSGSSSYCADNNTRYDQCSLAGNNSTYNKFDFVLTNCTLPNNTSGNISITKTVVGSHGPYHVGDPVAFDIVIRNNGDTTYSNVKFYDSYDSAILQYVSGTVTLSNLPNSRYNLDDLLDVKRSGYLEITNITNKVAQLLPGQYFSIRVNYIVRAPTPNTCNIAFIKPIDEDEKKSQDCVTSENVNTDL